MPVAVPLIFSRDALGYLPDFAVAYRFAPFRCEYALERADSFQSFLRHRQHEVF